MAAQRRTIRACESCRLLKIRCIKNDDPGILLCENCEKSGHNCIFVPLVKTRRRKRADARVTELEKEVRDLATLLRQGEDGKLKHTHPSFPADDTPGLRGSFQMSNTAPPATDQTWLELGTFSDLHFLDAALSNTDDVNISNDTVSTVSLPTNLPTSGQFDFLQPLQEDVIDRGLLDWAVALQLFSRYQLQLAPCYPIVPLADKLNPADVRRAKPVLFLAIIAAAAAVSTEELRDALHEEILQTYATCVMIKGIRSLELLQAMLVTITWYRPCGSYNDTKYLQFTQAASLMAYELDIGKPIDNTTAQLSDLPIFDQNPANSQSGYSPWPENQQHHAEGIECYRTLLAVFVQSSTYVLSTLC